MDGLRFEEDDIVAAAHDTSLNILMAEASLLDKEVNGSHGEHDGEDVLVFDDSF